jgi:hypothetical protein|eukprot:COSAG01_NODE_781_length_13657_cov_12.763239_5_plen_67_part_00
MQFPCAGIVAHQLSAKGPGIYISASTSIRSAKYLLGMDTALMSTRARTLRSKKKEPLNLCGGGKLT